MKPIQVGLLGIGTVGSGVQEVIANTKGTVSSLLNKGAGAGTPAFSMT